MNKLILLGVLLACFSCTSPSEPKLETPLAKADPLSLWNDSPVKTAINAFVAQVTDTASADFVQPADRIAVFDNDGTLWCEEPLIPLIIQLAYIKTEYPNHPDWKNDKVFTGIANDDLSVLAGMDNLALINKLMGANDGQKEEDYKKFVYQTLSTVQDKRFNRPLKAMTFSPMVQLVHYLQGNGFEVYIVTGGEITAVRTVSNEIYNIPKENVVGSSVLLSYVSDSTGCYLVRTEQINSANDKQVKPTNIELHIGKKPIFAAGNSDGDYQMMEYTLAGGSPSMAILVHHDDESREYSYLKGTEKAVADAPVKGWHVVSMKNDFKEIFAN